VERRQNQRKWPMVVSLIGLALAAVLAWWWQNRGDAGAKAPSATSVAGQAAAPGGAAAPGAGGGPAQRQAGGAGGTTPGGTTPGGTGGAGQGAGQGGAPGPVAVEIGKAAVMTLDDDAQAVGTMQARQGVMIRPEVSGRVSRLGFKDGQTVRRGQVLLQLDDTLQQAQWRQAQAQAAIARTNWQRQRDLVAQNFVSQSAVDQAAAALEVAEAQVALNRAQVSRMRVLAPFDGVAGIGNLDVGDYVREGADVVALDDVSRMTVDFRLPERYVSRVKAGQPVSIQVDALPGKSFVGHVQALDSQLDTNGRSLLVRASIDNSQRALITGMFARTRIVFASRANAVVVPEEALVPQGGKQWLVKVVDGPTGGAKVSQKIEVPVGIRVAGKVEVLQGLAAGDTVVTAGHARLLARDGVPVRVIDLDRVGTGEGRAPSGAQGGGGQGASGQAKPPARSGNAASGMQGGGPAGNAGSASAVAPAKP
jgi:membrane fusion protein, multidrug efflux system